jgi:HEAT repeat protein
LPIVFAAAFALVLATAPVRAQSVWDRFADFIGLHGKPAPASANVLSEHEIEVLDQMTPQAQAELLLERTINHYRGANDQIAKRVDKWRGNVIRSEHLDSLVGLALDSDDLRVRAAAIEIELAEMNYAKNSASIDALENTARFGEQSARMDALWYIALLGNRAVEPHRAFEIVSASFQDSNQWVRSAAVNALAYLGTDETIVPLLERFHNEPNPGIREQAA